MRRTLAVLAALVVAGAYTAACAWVPLPALEPALETSQTQEFAHDQEFAAEVVNAQSEPTAIGWEHSDAVWVNDTDAHPIASITKLVTVLVGLEAEPLEPGSAGPTYTVGPEAEQIRAEVLSQNGVAHDTPDGLELTTREMLQLILLPSSNNYAIAYADWVFGSEQAFVDAAAEWAEQHGLESLRVVEPTGLSEENVANVEDLVQLSRIALENPVVAEIVAEPWADIPEIGPIENSNTLLGENGVVGLKTGTLFESGYSIVAASRAVVDDRELLSIAAVLGRDDTRERNADARAALSGAEASVETVEILSARERVGSVVAWDGTTVALEAQEGVFETLVPGEAAERRLEIGAITEGARGSTVGVVRVGTQQSRTQVPVVTTARIDEPGLWWRLTHPTIVFGWVDPEPGDAEPEPADSG